MGEGAAGVNEAEAEIERLRAALSEVAHELDVRRHELLDWRLQLRRHWLAATVTAGALLAVTGGLILWTIEERRRPRSLGDRLARLLPG